MKVAAAIVVLVLGAVAFLLADVAPPASVTARRMELLRQAAEDFKRNNHRCASSVQEVAGSAGNELDVRDAWGREIAYQCDPRTNEMVITSLGEDGKAGGEGADADQRIAF